LEYGSRMMQEVARKCFVVSQWRVKAIQQMVLVTT
jgi:hypothetical protein